MKTILYFIAAVMICIACSEEKVPVYKQGSYIRIAGLAEDGSVTKSMSIEIDKNQQYDTLNSLRVEVIGFAAARPRRMKLEQYYEEGQSGVPAMPGIMYIPFDDPEMEKYMVMPADSTTVIIPLVFINNQDTLDKYPNKMRLYFRLVETEDFKVSSVKHGKGVVNIARQNQ